MTRARLRILVALLVLTFACTTAAAVVDTGTRSDPAQTVSRAPETVDTVTGRPDSRSSLLVIGDSFVAGAGVAYAGEAYPALLADATGMRLMLDGQGGTGFINDARGTGNGDTAKMIDRLVADGQKFPEPSVVVVDAGRNDLLYPIGDIERAVSKYLRQARAQWPTAEIVVVLPTFITPQPFDRYLAVLSCFKSSAIQVDAMLIDPIYDGWYQNVDTATLLSADQVHPNADGAALIAKRMEGSLRSYGLVPRDI